LLTSLFSVSIKEMMSKDDLLRLVSPVLRARGWRLYTGKGRLVDLWQYGGRAVLGHNPPNMLRAFKNNAERGLFAAMPHFAEDRLYKALAALLPGRTFRLYPPEELAQQLQKIPPDKIAVWRPYLNDPAVLTAPVLLPVLPCVFPGIPAVLAFTPAAVSELPPLSELPPSRFFSPVSLAAAARSIHDLLANPERGNPHYPKLDRIIIKNPVWKRQGIYLNFIRDDKMPSSSAVEFGGNSGTSSSASETVPESYIALFKHFLDKGFLLPPSPEDPAILPGELSPGEEAKLAAALEG